MDLQELKELKDALCTEPLKRIERIDKRMWWFNTLAISNLVVMIGAMAMFIITGGK